MRVVIRWRTGRVAVPADQRNARLQHVLRAARQTSFYQRGLPATPVLVEHGLLRLPPVPWKVFRERREEFHNRRAPLRRERRLWHPLTPPPRTAILGSGFRQSSVIREFGAAWSPDLARFRPEALAGPPDVLVALARKVISGQVAFPSLRYAVIAFAGMPLGTLSPGDRDILWRAFEVPVFEQILGLGGEPLATECEAHQGLHLRLEEAVFELRESDGQNELMITSLDNLEYPVLRLATGLHAGIDSSVCGCGRRGPRIVSLSPLGAAKADVVPAAAPIAARTAAFAGTTAML